VGWHEDALADAGTVKQHFDAKYGWRPLVTHTADAVDVVVHLHGGRLGQRHYALRLRYLPDWQVAGRREAFVDPDDHSRDGPEHWPPDGMIRGVNPVYRAQPNGALCPCVCLRGVYGYHSILHPNERPDGIPLLNFLLELQAVIDE
jgi:hypothetical protein